MLELLSVAERGAQVFVEIFGDFHAMASEIVAAELDGLAQDGVDVHEFALHGTLASETEQILDDVFGALCFVKNDLQVFAGLLGTAGFSSKRSVKPRMAARGLLTSWATPETRRPMVAIVRSGRAWLVERWRR